MAELPVSAHDVQHPAQEANPVILERNHNVQWLDELETWRVRSGVTVGWDINQDGTTWTAELDCKCLLFAFIGHH